MAVTSVEERLTTIEQELALLKQQLATDKPQTTMPWWEQRFGAFANSEGSWGSNSGLGVSIARRFARKTMRKRPDVSAEHGQPLLDSPTISQVVPSGKR